MIQIKYSWRGTNYSKSDGGVLIICCPICAKSDKWPSGENIVKIGKKNKAENISEHNIEVKKGCSVGHKIKAAYIKRCGVVVVRAYNKK